MATLNFNANQVEPSGEFDPLPAGKYLTVITASEMKPTKSTKGSFLELTMEVAEGEFRGRKLWARLNLENPNVLAVQIARAELSSICRAVGVMEPKDSCELHGIPLVATVKQKADPDGEIRNEIKGYSKRESAGPAKPAQAPSGAMPWQRK